LAFGRELEPKSLPVKSRVARVSDAGSASPGDCFKNPALAWETLGYVDREKTGFERNHNCCFARDPYGRVPPGAAFPDIMYTMSVEDASWQKPLYSYRLHRLSAPAGHFNP
jgi:hypothetical protein